MDRKVAIITGASRGIGRAIALGLAQDGFDLSLVARSQEGLAALASELEGVRPGGCHTTHVLDVTDFAALRNMVAAAHERYGRIDLLVNNAGTYQAGTAELNDEEFESMLRINLTAPWVAMKAVMPIMRQQGSGHVVNIASRAGKVGFAGDGGYVASKFGLVGLNESFYREMAEAGICVTAICPGWTNTEMAQMAGTPLAGEEMIQPGDILQTIRWLLSLSPAARVREVVLECRRSIA